MLFSESNPHYVCVWEIYNTILYYQGTTRLEKIFTTENIVILQWLIADDWRQYRQRVLTKAHLTSRVGFGPSKFPAGAEKTRNWHRGDRRRRRRARGRKTVDATARATVDNPTGGGHRSP